MGARYHFPIPDLLVFGALITATIYSGCLCLRYLLCLFIRGIWCRSVSAVAPGVLATTGIESLELVRGAVRHVQPECVLCIDALAAGSMDRLCRTVQCTNVGIAPGSGVGNRRAAFSEKSLGVPVFAVGVPTVVDGGEGMIVTPRDIDAQIRYLSALLAAAINLSLHPMFDYEDFTQFVPIYG